MASLHVVPMDTSDCINCGTSGDLMIAKCFHLFCENCYERINICPQCKQPTIVSRKSLAPLKLATLVDSLAKATPPPLEPLTAILPPQPPSTLLTTPPQALQHFSFTCPGLHGAGSHTQIQRTSFEHLFNPQTSKRVIIPLFQRSFCWNSTTTVPAWWRDTAKATAHSCGKLVFKMHDGAWWCLDGQQRVTTTMLLVVAARDALLRLQQSSDLANLSTAIAKFDAVLFVDVSAAYAFAASSASIAEGQRLSFSRLVPSYCDRHPYFQLIIGGLVTNGLDTLLTEITTHSAQYDTKRYFDGQFQHILNSSSTPSIALDTVVSRATAALNVQMIMVEPQSDINVAQVYQWLQESSLLSMGALLFNPSPGMKMHACDLARNLFMSPWTGEPLGEQEEQYAELWLAPIEVPCGSSPSRIDGVLRVLVDSHIPNVQPSETEQRLLAATHMPGFSKHDLSGLILYARVLTLWEHFEDEVRGSITNTVQRQKSMAIRIMRLMGAICIDT